MILPNQYSEYIPRETGGPRGAILPPRRPRDPLGPIPGQAISTASYQGGSAAGSLSLLPCCPAALLPCCPASSACCHGVTTDGGFCPRPCWEMGKCAGDKVLSCFPHLSLDSTVRHNPPCMHRKPPHTLARRTCHTHLQPHISHTSRTCSHTPHA